MIEAYAFLAMFTVQILLMSVLHPARLINYCRAKLAEIPAERYPQMDAGVFRNLSTTRFLNLYRALNTGIAVLGVMLLGFMFSEVRLLDWDKMTAFYFVLQASPLLLLAVIGLRYIMVYRSSMLQGKRKAFLQRRGLFDFVSPFAVFVAVAIYFLFVAYMLYIAKNPNVGFDDSLIGIGTVTLVYALSAFEVYRMLYGRKLNPLETHAGHVHMIGLAVKSAAYGCIVCVVFLALIFTLEAWDLQSWKPFAVSACLVTSGLICLTAFAVPPRKPEADGLGSSRFTEVSS